MAADEVREYRSPNRRHDRNVFYKYVTAEVAKIILATRRLRWSSPLLFNDPFDVTQELRLDFDEAELNALLTEKWASLLPQEIPNITFEDPTLNLMMRLIRESPAEARRAAAEELRQIVEPPMPGQSKALTELKAKWKEEVPRIRILCLSELHDVTPMWLHYSDNYKGVVLEFEAVDGVDSAFLVARPVIYQDDPPAIATPEAWVNCLLGQGETTYEDLFKEYQYVKTLDWSSEKEWRIVSGARPGEDGLFRDYGFSPREIVGVYFGSKCAERDRADLLSLLAHGLEHIRVYEAIPDIRRAKFHFQIIER